MTLKLTGLLVAFAGLFLLVLFQGPIEFSLSLEATQFELFKLIRLPKALTASLAGALLGLSGLYMQTLFRNPLAGPYVLGIQNGASLAMALLFLAPIEMQGVWEFLGPLGASLVGAMGVLLVVLFMEKFFIHAAGLLVVGLLLGHMSAGLIQILANFAPASKVQRFLIWGFGSFSRTSPEEIPWLAGLLFVGLLGGLLVSRELDLIQLGDETAEGAGVSRKFMRKLLILLSGILTGVVTAFCGPVFFLGVISPHVTRTLLKTDAHGVLLWGTLFVGAGLALCSQLLSELSFPRVLPLNAVTGAIAVPVLIFFFLSGRKRTV